MAENLDFEMCFGLSTLGAGAKTRLESRIKKFTPHCVCRLTPEIAIVSLVLLRMIRDHFEALPRIVASMTGAATPLRR